jgi:hypothetical protein
MRSRLGVAAGRGISAALLLLLVTSFLGVPSPATARDTRAAQLQRTAARTLAAVTQAFAVKPRRTAGHPLPYTDVSVLLNELRRVRGDLSPADRATADRFLATPARASDGSYTTCTAPILGGKVIKSDHFCIHYGSDTTDAWAQTTDDTLEHVYAFEVGTLGYQPPMDDGDGLLDVTLTELGDQGIYGYCTTTTNAVQSPAYCDLDNNFSTQEFGAPPTQSLEVTAAHEFFHAIQFSYDTAEPVWMLEGTAVWMEGQVYPAIKDYVQYLPYSAIREPGTPVNGGGEYERYGAVMFWRYLSESLRDRSVIKQIWQYGNAGGANLDALPAIQAALRARGLSFGPTFAKFAAWNTLPASSYVDRHYYLTNNILPLWALVRTLTMSAPGTGLRSVTLAHLSSSAYQLRPGGHLPRGARVRFVINGPPHAGMPQAMIQVRFRSGAVSYVPVALNGAGDGIRGVPFDPRTVSSVVLTLSNASLFGTDGERFTFRARMIP